MWPTIAELRTAAHRPPTSHQEEQYQCSTAGPVGILRGGPGTGKSFTTAAAIKAILTTHGPEAIDIAAPTGKAAQRIGELLSEYHISGIRPKTIHSLLGPTRNGHDGDGWSFMFDRTNPLRSRFLLADEFSMADIRITRDLLSACPNGMHVLFIGDPYQLPPVGNGSPFADMIRAGIPSGNLTEVHRFSGRVATVCEAIRDKKQWQPSGRVNLEAESPENFKHLEYKHAGQCIEACQIVIDRMIQRGRDPKVDLQVICPTNEKSPLARSVLNDHLQKMLNPTGTPVEGSKYRVGDKVVNRKNTWFNVADGHGQTWIANGETGVVLKAAGNGSLTVDYSTGCEADSEEKVVLCPRGSWRFIKLAYAITGHSSQGSQWPVVIAMIDEYQPSRRICDRSWWYTVLSRSSELMVTIGKMATLKSDCRGAGVESRRTFLSERIRSE